MPASVALDNALNVPPYWQDIIRGGILLVAVTADHLLNTRKSKG